MVRPAEGSPEWLAETNDPYLDQRVSIVFIVIDTLFLAIFYISRYYNPKAIGRAMLWCNTLCYICCLGSATTGIRKFLRPRFAQRRGFLQPNLSFRHGDLHRIDPCQC